MQVYGAEKDFEVGGRGWGIYEYRLPEEWIQSAHTHTPNM